MKTRSSLGFFVVVSLVAGAGGAAWWSRFQQTLALRNELTVQRLSAEDLARLKVDNQRLKARQVSAAELEALRADHAAVVRLRAEIESLGRAASGK